MSEDNQTEEMLAEVVPPFEPVAISPALAELLPRLYGYNQYELSDDKSQILVWRFPGPIPNESDCRAALMKAKMDGVRSQRDGMMAKSDQVALRCFKAGQDFPADWKAFTQALRDWPTNPDGAVPVEPAMPPGV